MRTFVALVLLAAVASNGFTMKYGPLKGSWFNEIYVDGYAVDTDAPTMTGFKIEGSASDYAFDASDGYYTVTVTYTVDDDDSDTSCSLDFQMWNADDEVIAMWSSGSVGTGAQSVDVPVNMFGMEGDYLPMLECMDTTGNMRYWTVDEGLAKITFTNALADTVGYDLDGYSMVPSANIDLDDDYYYDTPLPSILVSVDYSESSGGDVTMRSARGAGEMWLKFTADDPSIEDYEDMYTGVCTGPDIGGTCTFTIYPMASWEFGTYEVTGITVWDTAGNMGMLTTGLDDFNFQLGNAPDDVLSCQSLDFDSDSYDYYDSIDTTTTNGHLYLVANCNSQSILQSDANTVSVTFGTWATLDVYEEKTDTLLGASYASDYLDYDTSKAYLDVVFMADMCPRGYYQLQSVTTTTQWGGVQYYTIEEGSAATLSAMFGMVLAVVVALF